MGLDGRDNVTVGNTTIGTNHVDGVDYLRTKMVYGLPNQVIDVSIDSPLPVQVEASAGDSINSELLEKILAALNMILLHVSQSLDDELTKEDLPDGE